MNSLCTLLNLILLILMLSGISFMLFFIDKRAAISGKQRIPESHLLFFGLLGGWPGSLLGQRLFRHKTKKVSFRVRLYASVVISLIGYTVFLANLEIMANYLPVAMTTCLI